MFDCRPFRNQFYRHLISLLGDAGSSNADILLAYRDALSASDDPENAALFLHLKSNLTASQSSRFGLRVRQSGQISLTQSEHLFDLDLKPIYRLEQRRFIHTEMLDPALASRLNDETYSHYRGKAQQLAVRIALTSKQNRTILVNLPTGCGKTLVAQALGLFAASNSLTVVIVPTIGLAIEQGSRNKRVPPKSRRGALWSLRLARWADKARACRDKGSDKKSATTNFVLFAGSRMPFFATDAIPSSKKRISNEHSRG